MNRSRLLVRAATPLAAAACVLALAGPAAAHVEVESATARALATDAVVAFDAEAESAGAGIKQVKVVLPTGIALYALDEDLAARGLTAPERVQAVDYPGFVELCSRYAKVNSWL